MHTMVVLCLISMLSVEDLAEHILIAVASRVNGGHLGESSQDVAVEDGLWMWDVDCWSKEKKQRMSENIVTLMEAAGERITPDCDKEKGIHFVLTNCYIGFFLQILLIKYYLPNVNTEIFLK